MLNLDLSARELILALIDSTAIATLNAAYFVAAGRLFDMHPNAVRVALGRLVKDQSLIQVARGVYSLGSRGGELHAMVRNWSTIEQTLKPWDGGWLAAYLGQLTRTNKSKVRARERALRLVGFAAADANLWLRPDNFLESLIMTRCRLVHLGLEETVMISKIEEFQPTQAIDPSRLWDRVTMESRYQWCIEQLAASVGRLATLNSSAAARETLLLGRSVTRVILLDPLLPEQMVNQYSTNLLGKWVREKQIMSLEDAVYRLTGKTALMHELDDIGFIAPGKAADIVIFDPDTIASKPRVPVDYPPAGANARHVKRDAIGIDYVIVNGEVLLEDGEHTGALPGRVLRGPLYQANG